MFATAVGIGCLVVGCLVAEVIRRVLEDTWDQLKKQEPTMCDIASIQIAEEIVQEKVRAAEMFTAFDVSREAHKRGSQERHRHLKEVTHAAFARGEMGTDYTRTLIRVRGAKAQAWLYHRKPDDPNTYGAAQGQAPVRRGRPVDGRLRLCVPVRPLRQAGLTPGDSVWVTADTQQQCVVISKTNPGTRVLATYQVERTGNIRIGPRVFKKAGLTGGAFDIDGDGNSITVKPV